MGAESAPMLKLVLEVFVFAFWLWASFTEFRSPMVERIALLVWVGFGAFLLIHWLPRRVVLFPLVGAVAIGMLWWLWPVKAEAPTIELSSGERVLLYEGVRLPAKVGHATRFTPVPRVSAPMALTNVNVSMCVPHGIAVGESAAWNLNSNDGCAEYVARIGAVNIGSGVNPAESLFLTPMERDDFLIQWTVTSQQLSPAHGSFVVVATP